ncbi:hypothetical protein KGQ20_46650, partial [Catenulispora sp. NF23]|nr:hypothetical protein [Catenulispora pinistramenti]
MTSNPATSTKPLLGTRQLAGYVLAEAAANTTAPAAAAETPSVQRATRPEPVRPAYNRPATQSADAAASMQPTDTIQRSAAAAAAPAQVPAPGSAATTPPLATTASQNSAAQQPPAGNSTGGAPHGINSHSTSTSTST